MSKGILIRWNEEKGFGFIKPENNKNEIFIHISALKKMRRKPVVGDAIHFQIHTQSDGKNRAVNARIEGVKENSFKARRKKNTSLKSKFIIYLLISIVFFVYQKFSNEKKVPAALNPEQQIKFECDGRQYCSQMKSRAEAVFFIRNCPDTKMDGDYDGIPCENDSRF